MYDEIFQIIVQYLHLCLAALNIRFISGIWEFNNWNLSMASFEVHNDYELCIYDFALLRLQQTRNTVALIYAMD